MRTQIIFILFLLILPFGLSDCAAPETKISQLEKWTLVVSNQAIQSERYAAKEFQSLFKDATGIDLTTTDAPPKADHNIFIGPGQAMEESDVGFPVNDLGEEGLRIRISEKNIAIAGGRPRGTLYGVYTFFERYLGVRFLAKDHTYIPHKIWEASLPSDDFTFKPRFEFRWSYYGETRLHPEYAVRLRINTTTREERLGGMTSQQLINHSLSRLLPVQKYGKEHPEYFALVRGERKLQMWGGGPEPCVTHPDVIDIVTAAVLREIEEHPERANVSVSQNDNDAYCRCAGCEAINQPEESPMGAHLAFVNTVADRVKEKHPDKKIGTLSYWHTRKPPKTIQPRDNVQIQFADIESCRLHAIEDLECPKNRPVHADLEAWCAISDQIYIWSYATDFRYYDLPFPNLRAIGPNIQYFARLGVKGVFMQANGGGTSGDFSDLRNYVIARLLWNPELDGWALVEEFCRLHYGKAAPAILEYLEWMHDNAESSGMHPGCFATPMELGLGQEAVQKMFTYFIRARAAAENETIRDRVEKASIAAYRAMLEAGGEWKVENWRLRRVFPESYGDVIGRYIALCKKHEMTMPDERTRFESFEKDLNEYYRKGYPAAVIENDTWRITVLNEDNGKAVEMLHKPSGRNLVNALANNLKFGTFEEWTEKDRDQNAVPHKFEAAVTKNTITLSRKIDYSATYERRISLPDDGSGKILCETKITHHGEKPKTYQVIVHPEFNAGTDRHDWDIVNAYVKRDGEWVIYNKEMVRDEGPDTHLLLGAREGGGHAYFNHEEGFGVLETYEPGKVERLRTWWRPEYVQFNIEIMTRAVELEQGKSFSFSYAFEFLEAPPQ